MLLSLLWGAGLLTLFPSMLSLPWTHLIHWDFGWLVLASASVALAWGVLIRPSLVVWSLNRMEPAPEQTELTSFRTPGEAPRAARAGAK